jgi:hypothetical protein
MIDSWNPNLSKLLSIKSHSIESKASNYTFKYRHKINCLCLSSKIQESLALIVSNDQSGYIKNRYIGFNIRQIQDIIDYSEHLNIEGAILFNFKTSNLFFISYTISQYFYRGNKYQRSKSGSWLYASFYGIWFRDPPIITDTSFNICVNSFNPTYD